jgi:hypothetical protein
MRRKSRGNESLDYPGRMASTGRFGNPAGDGQTRRKSRKSSAKGMWL